MRRIALLLGLLGGTLAALVRRRLRRARGEDAAAPQARVISKGHLLRGHEGDGDEFSIVTWNILADQVMRRMAVCNTSGMAGPTWKDCLLGVTS